jgi:biopolymer transport protein ExbD
MIIKLSRRYKRGKIEIIPMIDVMFFLLVTFMLASLALQNIHSLPVDLPQGSTQVMHAESPITLTITKDSHLFLNKTPVTLDQLPVQLKAMMNHPNIDIIVAADSAAPNGITVQAMLKARSVGAEHFLIAIQHE